MTHDLDNAEKSFEWSKVLLIREWDYIQDLAVKTLGEKDAEEQYGIHNPAPSGMPDIYFDQKTYQEDLATMARILGYLRAKDELAKHRLTFAEGRSTLEEQLREAEQVREDMQFKRKAELDRLYEFMEAAGIPVEEEDLPPASSLPPQEIIRGDHRWSVTEAQLHPSRGNSQRRRRRAKQKSPGRSPRPKLHQGLAPFPPKSARTPSSRTSPEALRHQVPAQGLPWATPYRRGVRLNSAQQNRLEQASIAGAQRQVSVPAGQGTPRQLHDIKLQTPRKLVEQRVTAAEFSIAGPGSQDLLLYGSSHRVVSEGAKGGALHFWLEPQSARPAPVDSSHLTSTFSW